MRIGFLSGDVFEMDNTRKGVSVPDYPVQGYLMEKLANRGHETVLYTRVPKGVKPPEGVEYRPDEYPKADVLFTDRLGTAGSEHEDAMQKLLGYGGPVVYHSYVPYPGWAPPFQEVPDLLRGNKRWLVLNRADDPYGAYMAMTGEKEQVEKGVVEFAKWEPFLMKLYPWMGHMPDLFTAGGRAFVQGYYGRVPKGEKRARSVVRWLNHDHWSSVVYGPLTSTAWLARRTGAHDGGRIEHRDLPRALSRFDFIVQAPIDRFIGKGVLNYVPHRVVECALAGVFQLFDAGMGLPGLERWSVSSPVALRQWATTILSPRVLRKEVAHQRQTILTVEREPSMVIERLERLLEAHAKGEKCA